tara:strand:- start:415 stop:633 length:219 start_codon:yes stop_codon:yes gene_type:complete
MNFILVGVIAPLAYFLLRLVIKSAVQNFILNLNRKSNVAEVKECQNCGVFKPIREMKRVDNSFQCLDKCSNE